LAINPIVLDHTDMRIISNLTATVIVALATATSRSTRS
jgi:hypothetical protein